MTDLTVKLTLTADGSQLKAEVQGAAQAVQRIGPTTQGASQQASTALKQIETASNAATFALRGISLQATQLSTITVQATAASRALAVIPQVVNALPVNPAARYREIFAGVATDATAAGAGISRLGALGQVAFGLLGGGIAGVVTQLGALALQYLRTSDSTDRARTAHISYAEAVERSNGVLRAGTQAAEDQRRAKAREAAEVLEAAAAYESETLALATNASARALAVARRLEEAVAEGRAAPGQVEGGLARAQATARGIAELYQQAETRLADLQRRAAEARRLAQTVLTGEQFGPPAPAAPRTGAGGGTQAGGLDRRLDQLREAQAKADETLRRSIDPVAAYNARVDELRGALFRYAITQDQFNTGLTEAEEKLAKAGQAASSATPDIDRLEKAIEGLGDRLDSAGKEAADSFAKMALGIDGADFSVKKLAQTLASGVLSKLIQDQITRPLTQAIIELAKLGLTNIGGLFGGGALSGTNAAASANLAASGPSGLVIPPLHTGGIAGLDVPALRRVDPMVFAGAPRFHTGGIVSGEVPAILRRGEGVFTEAQMRALGPAAPTTVQIIDQRGANAAPAEVQEGRGPNGERQLRVLIRDTMKGLLSDGSMDATMRGNFNVARRGA
jgi:hypothetical protein